MAKKAKRTKREKLEALRQNVQSCTPRKLAWDLMAKLLFSDKFLQFSSIALVLLILPNLFFKSAFNLEPIQFSGEKLYTEARVMMVNELAFVPLKRPIFKVDYRIAVDGKAYTGSSFLTGWVPKANKLEVEYVKGNPEQSRAVGGQTTFYSFPMTVLFIALLLLFSFRVSRSIRVLFVLKFGLKAKVNFTGVKPYHGEESGYYTHHYKFVTQSAKVVTSSFLSKYRTRKHSDKLVYYLKSKPKVNYTASFFEKRSVLFHPSKDEVFLMQGSSPLAVLVAPIALVAALLLSIF